MPFADNSITFAQYPVCLEYYDSFVDVMLTTHRDVPSIVRKKRTEIDMLTTASVYHLTGH